MSDRTVVQRAPGALGQSSARWPRRAATPSAVENRRSAQAAGPAIPRLQFDFANIAIMPKRLVGEADDPFEQEADRIADRVMRTAAPPAGDHEMKTAASAASGTVQRKCEACEEDTVRRKVQSGAE